MKNEKIIEIARKTAAVLTEEQKRTFDDNKKALALGIDIGAWGCVGEGALLQALAALEYLALEDVKAEKVKAAGTGEKVKAARAIISQLAWRDPDHGAYIDEGAENGYILMGCYSMVRLRERFEGAPELAKTPRERWHNYEKVIGGLRDAKAGETGTVKLPTFTEIKNYIKIEKAAHAGQRGYTPAYDFGDDRPKVDALLLRDVVALLGDDAEAVLHGKNGMLYCRSAAGDGVLCPKKS